MRSAHPSSAKQTTTAACAAASPGQGSLAGGRVTLRLGQIIADKAVRSGGGGGVRHKARRYAHARREKGRP